MSVHVIDRASAPGFEVRFRDLAGVNRSVRFDASADAIDFDHAIRAKVALERATRAWNAIPAGARADAERFYSE